MDTNTENIFPSTLGGSSSRVTPVYVYLNGDVVMEDEAVVSIRDRGFLYGDAIFETLRSYDGRPFMLKDHLERLMASAHALGIHTEHTTDELHQAVMHLLDLNKLKDAYIRITLSRGEGGKGLMPDATSSPTLVIENRPLRPYPDELYKKGIRLIVSDYRRSTSDPIARHKTANFLTGIQARQEASKKDNQDALFLDTDGNVCEGTVWNIFMVEGSRVVTPSTTVNILPGITRKVVLKICRDKGIATSEELFPAERLLEADEVFITSSLMEIMPVATIANHRIGTKIPGKITRRLMEAYKKLTKVAPEEEGEVGSRVP
ncbi:MAG: aminodeoxychorismate lyase [Candidatus Brocadiales bacterium]